MDKRRLIARVLRSSARLLPLAYGDIVAAIGECDYAGDYGGLLRR